MSKITIRKLGRNAFIVSGGKKLWGSRLVGGKKWALQVANSRRRLLGRKSRK